MYPLCIFQKRTLQVLKGVTFGRGLADGTWEPRVPARRCGSFGGQGSEFVRGGRRCLGDRRDASDDPQEGRSAEEAFTTDRGGLNVGEKQGLAPAETCRPAGTAGVCSANSFGSFAAALSRFSPARFVSVVNGQLRALRVPAPGGQASWFHSVAALAATTTLRIEFPCGKRGKELCGSAMTRHRAERPT